VRVIPNKYPAFPGVGPDGIGSPEATMDAGPYQRVQMPGEQEVIVSSPRHVSSLSELNHEELHVSFRACQDRIGHLQKLEHVQHAMLFMNCRHSAGASLSHIHTQLIGSPVVSSYLLGRSERNDINFRNHGVSLIQTLTDWELKQETRIIYESDQFVVYCPYASRFAFQARIVPKKNQQHYCDCSPEMLVELSDLCRRLVARLENLLTEPGYNLLLNMAPFSRSENDHWYFEIFPRLTRAAGFEWGTDIWVNPVSPETAARRIRFD
jgi:UDPglucose--hexose-1-phosphate uridylyltransferase